MAAGLIGIHYWSAASNNFRYVVYNLAAFKARTAKPLYNCAEPTFTATSQGWTIASNTTIARIEGDGYTTTNLAPGNTTLLTMTMSGTVLSRRLITADSDMVYREPEGVGIYGGAIVEGFASGAAGTVHYGNVLKG
jgi:hypothetical protein